jgi:hypothetical protein
VRRDTAKLENASPYGSKPPAEISVAEIAALVWAVGALSAHLSRPARGGEGDTVEEVTDKQTTEIQMVG